MVGKEPEDRLKTKEKEMTVMRQGAQGLGEMKSSTQVRECVRQEEGHLPTKGEKGGHSWAGA